MDAVPSSNGHSSKTRRTNPNHMNLKHLAKRIIRRSIELAPRAARLRLRTAYGLKYDLDPEIVGLSRWLPSDRRSCGLDVGANNGVTTCALARVFDSVHAFEPNAEILREWERVAPENVTIWNCALSDQAGTGILNVPYDERRSYSGLGSLERLKGAAYTSQRSHEIPLKCLDGLIPLDQRVDFMKIDVEGHELSMLRGAKRILTTDRPSLAIEVWPQNRFAVHEFLSSIDYGLVPIFDLIGVEVAEQNLCYGPMDYWAKNVLDARRSA